MKSSEQLAEKLASQWNNADLREKRLLVPESWPISLAIGKPTATLIKHNLERVRKHIEQWRAVTIGKVVWNKMKYRDTLEAIEVPTQWQLQKPSEWIEATGNRSIKAEFQKLSSIVSAVDPQFHTLLVRQRHLTTDKLESEITQACALALELEQNCANGLPLRALSIAGIDSKFFERHRRLIIKLLDVRFEGLVSEIGLESFLNALNESDHWLLVADLDGSLLPFKQMRIRDSELKTTALPAPNILIIENEQCLHQLPPAEHTIAILGAGLNLSWMQSPWLSSKRLAYWGDIDTWGLTMLAQARRFQPALTALMMTKIIFEKEYSYKAVREPETAGNNPPEGLTAQESQLYDHLLRVEHGRLEQEFLSPELIGKTVLNWAATTI
jgi:hypothetical protein